MALDQLYREIILKASKDPANQQDIDDADWRKQGHNPLCGDRLEIALKFKDDQVSALGLKVRGCAIFNASAAFMRQIVEAAPLHQSQMVAQALLKAIAGERVELPETLAPLLSLQQHRSRHRCATLPWETLLEYETTP